MRSVDNRGSKLTNGFVINEEVFAPTKNQMKHDEINKQCQPSESIELIS